MKTSEQIADIATSLAKAQSAVKVAQKNKRNPHLKNEYSDIAAIWAACRQALNSNGISVVQQVTAAEGQKVAVTTLLMHSSGQWIELGPLEVPVQKFDAQGVGSAISYGKRYALSAAVGVVSGDEDDDAEGTGSQPTMTDEESSILQNLRAAALEGPDSLASAFEATPKSAAKASVWAQHGGALKAAAKAAMEQP